MRQTLIAAAAAFIAGGIVTGAALSRAQPTPPPVEHVMDRPAEHHRMGWMHHGGQGGRIDPRAFALIYRQSDRQLGVADVQKIAEGFLLWNGNHSWKVTDVAASAEGPIGFSLTTPEGSVVAKFTMDPHTGKIARAG